MQWLVTIIRKRNICGVFPSCQIKQLEWIYKTIPPDWLIAWYKGSPGHASAVGFNDWEPHLVYGKSPNFPIHDFFQTDLRFKPNGHPCPKPTAYTDWLVHRFTLPGGTVFEPFLGSGTTGVSSLKLGRKFIGCEIDPLYFDIACGRINDAHQQEGLGLIV
jgi:hypothetical protein